jgi:hypothetical protein
MDEHELVPSSKGDLPAAKRAVAAGWPAVERVLPELLEWIQDVNWPVAPVLMPFLASVGDPLVPYLRPILEGKDIMWKYWIVSDLLLSTPLTVVDALRPELERLLASPTQEEAEIDLPDEARTVLDRLGSARGEAP